MQYGKMLKATISLSSKRKMISGHTGTSLTTSTLTGPATSRLIQTLRRVRQISEISYKALSS